MCLSFSRLRSELLEALDTCLLLDRSGIQGVGGLTCFCWGVVVELGYLTPWIPDIQVLHKASDLASRMTESDDFLGDY